MSKVNVIGAGITGLMSAYFLAKKGHEVTVYEQERHPAMQCSFANGGQISVCNAETWNNWPTVYKGVKWLFKKDAPLLIRPYPSLRKIAWMAGFLKHTIAGSHLTNTMNTIRLGNTSIYEYDQIIKEEGIEFDQVKKGMMHVFTNEKDMQSMYDLKDFFNHNGLKVDMLSPDEVINKEGSLLPFKNLVGGAYAEADWSGDIHQFCTQLYHILYRKYNVKFKFNTFVEDPRHLSGKTVLANGHQLYDHAKLLGEFLNIYPVKGYSITINLNDRLDQIHAPNIPLLDNNKKIVTSRLGNKLRVAGTAELTDVNYDIRRDRIEPLLNWVNENFPGVNTHDYSQWACLRPMSSNMMPIVRQSKRYDNIYYHGGHGHLGWTLAAATGKQVADLI
jgi:D-amino-acid dehydrogenase